MKTLLAIALLAAAAPVRAAADVPILAVPGSAQAGTFATRAVAWVPGVTLSILNGDIVLHSVRSTATGPDTNAWCGPRNPGPESPTNPRRFPLGACPLFWSALASAQGGSQSVQGVDALSSGRAYGFVCSEHPSMTGVVLT